jgi:hypothetical protein
MKIAFHSNHLSELGSEVAMFDYAYYNQIYLLNQSIIVTKRNVKNNNEKIIEKFSKCFNILFYDNFSEVEKLLDENNVDVFYAIKSGEYDGIISKGRKTVIHAVFKAFQPHGKVYAYVSEWLAKQMNYGLNPWVPHMVDLPPCTDDLRNKLNIPKDKIVFGRYGGYDTFDIPFVHNAVKTILSKRNDIYFLFANTKTFYEHPNIIYLDIISDMAEKVKFINTCDAMLHARTRGETFGLACGEFSIQNKPIFTYGLSPEKNHLEVLKDKAIVYNSEQGLVNKINNFIPSPDKNWDAYSQNFNPFAVMQKFKTVFL